MSPTPVRLFGGAAEAFGAAETEVEGAGTLKELVGKLAENRGEKLVTVLDQCSFFIDGEHHTTLETPLPDGSRVDVLPPFAGG